MAAVNQVRHPPVKHGGDASLGNGDGLLLHSFMDGHPVLISHLIKLQEGLKGERWKDGRWK